VGPAVRAGHGDESFDFRPEAHATVSVWFVAHVYDARPAMRFFRLVACDFRRHAQRGLYGHADLQGSRSGEVESALRNIKSFREMLALIGSKAHGFEANWGAERVTG